MWRDTPTAFWLGAPSANGSARGSCESDALGVVATQGVLPLFDHMHSEPTDNPRARQEISTPGRGLWCLGSSVGLVGVLAVAVACSSVSLTPLADAHKTPRQEYLYGPTGYGSPAPSDDEEVAQEDEALEDTGDEETKESEEEDSEDFEVIVASDEESDKDEPSASSPASVAGTYRGTDWVTILMPGFPEDEQVDDQARVVLAVLDKPERYSFAVLDTRTGDELCKIVGTLKESVITFDEDQTCFAGILGVAMEANMSTGLATIDGKSLAVTLGVELRVNTPNGELTGDLDYRFEGKK